MCNIHALLTQSVIREVEQSEAPDEDFSVECAVFSLSSFFFWLLEFTLTVTRCLSPQRTSRARSVQRIVEDCPKYRGAYYDGI
jgi:hypothetical protein